MSYWVIVVMMAFLVTSFLATRFMIGGVPALFTKTICSIGFVFAGIQRQTGVTDCEANAARRPRNDNGNPKVHP